MRSLVFLLGWVPAILLSQPSFEELVDQSFGSDQAVVNGIQFSNQYIRITGNPYFLDGNYRPGKISVHEQWYPVNLRYNLYTQRVEIEYLTPAGHMNQLITVPEQISAFLLEGHEFRRMQAAGGPASYYMVLSHGESECFIR